MKPAHIVATAIVFFIAVALVMIFSRAGQSPGVCDGLGYDDCIQALSTQIVAARSTPRPVPNEQSVTRSGQGIMESSSFALRGGDYRADWTGSDTGLTTVGCFNGLTLQSQSPSYYGQITTNEVDGGGTASGTSYLHGVPSGQRYYVKASSGCKWRVTITLTAPAARS